MMKRVIQVFILTISLQISGISQIAPFAQPSKLVKLVDTSASQYSSEIRQFDEFVAHQMKFDKTPGLTVGFMKDDFVWVKGYGYADLENKVPAKAESAYRLASVTKSMTALAIMQLVEKKKIDLDAEVQTYVPYFPRKQWPVTVREVLGHLGGISHYKDPAKELHIKDHKSTREAIAIFQDFALVAEPGTRFSYSSYGYNLLGAIVEAASGMSYGDYLRQNVWIPAGMTDTRMDDPEDLISNRVRGYQLVNGAVKNSEFADISSRFAAGGTRSTVPDLLKYARSIIDGRFLSKEGMITATTSMSTRDGRLTNYAMGWETTPSMGRYMLAHSGGQQETTTLLYILPSQKLAFAIGMNFESGNPGVYLDRLFQLITGAPRDLPFYSSDRASFLLADGMNSTFNYGLAYFEHYRKPMTNDPAELARAFAYFNTNVNSESLKANPQATAKRIHEGVHPVAQQAFTKVGSFIAERLAEKYGPVKLDSYAALGGLVFMADYMELTKSDASISKDYQLNEGLKPVLAELARDWQKTDTEYVRSLALTTDTDLDAVGRNLHDLFDGASIYPSLVDELFAVARQSVLTRNLPNAVKAGRVAFYLYPEAPAANYTYGLALIMSGDSTAGQERLRKAAALNPNGPASASGLNNVAFQLARAEMLDAAMVLLASAIQLYPKEANLYDSMGELQLRKGDKSKALESYKKALELDPNFPNATAARDLVKKLGDELAKDN